MRCSTADGIGYSYGMYFGCSDSLATAIAATAAAANAAAVYGESLRISFCTAYCGKYHSKKQ